MAAAALCALWAVAVHLPSLRVASSPTLERGALSRIRAVASAPPTLLEAELEAALASRPRVVRSELDPWREYDPLRAGIDRTTLRRFFRKRPQAIGRRFTTVARTLTRARREWERAAPAVAEGEKSAEFDPTKDVRDDGPGGGRGGLLCERLSSLGPLSIKVAQTLSQRPDLVGDEAATALKRLQTANTPFDDALAWAVLKENLGHVGPIAPGVGVDPADPPDAPPLFAKISASPVAVASLGQVYKATLHDGLEVAVKVQRPDAMAILAKDYFCFILAVAGTQKFVERFRGFDSDGRDMGAVLDRVAQDILQEIDYTVEAANAERFEASLEFLGFVTTPVVVPAYSGTRVLVTEWVKGQHLSALPEDDGLRMTRMAVEACTASLVLTGFVHADPHEGNLMLADDGRLVFLDFGLMSAVDDDIMEAFARGIQAALAEDYVALAQAFKDTGFVNDPIIYYPDKEKYGIDPETGEDTGLAAFAVELTEAMRVTDGSDSRFGALATVLNQELSPRWKMFTPPYVLLLIRTFLTLEGIADRVDPDFNIYEMAMPWAIRRSLSPKTVDGIAAMRSTFLTPDNRVQWERLLDVASSATTDDADDADAANAAATAAAAGLADAAAAAATAPPPTVDAAAAKAKAEANAAAKSEAMNAAVASLLGSPQGKALRKALRDVDSTDLAAKLLSREARALRHAAAVAVCGTITSPWREAAAPEATADEARPTSDAVKRLAQRQGRWKRKIALLLVRSHLERQFNRGWRGALALSALVYLPLRILVGGLRQALLRAFPWLRIRSRPGGGDAPVAAA